MSLEAQTLIEKWLLESPSSISAASFGMDDPVKEARFVCKLKHDAGARVIDQFGGLDLVKVGQIICGECSWAGFLCKMGRLKRWHLNRLPFGGEAKRHECVDTHVTETYFLFVE